MLFTKKKPAGGGGLELEEAEESGTERVVEAGGGLLG
jgi:hypothetical protein